MLADEFQILRIESDTGERKYSIVLTKGGRTLHLSSRTDLGAFSQSDGTTDDGIRPYGDPVRQIGIGIYVRRRMNSNGHTQASS